jgi:ketosteroid isomerase-like protein
LSVLDIAEIRDLTGRLALAADEGDLATYQTLWAPDGVWDFRLTEPHSRIEGLDAIREHFVRRCEAGVVGPKTGQIHSITSQTIKVDGDQATGRAYMVVHQWTGDAPTLRTVVKYYDRYARIDGRWVLAHRVLMPARLGMAPPY